MWWEFGGSTMEASWEDQGRMYGVSTEDDRGYTGKSSRKNGTLMLLIGSSQTK
jgi:hypothetical protein